MTIATGRRKENVGSFPKVKTQPRLGNSRVSGT